jgi:hypothetical protein
MHTAPDQEPEAEQPGVAKRPRRLSVYVIAGVLLIVGLLAFVAIRTMTADSTDGQSAIECLGPLPRLH